VTRSSHNFTGLSNLLVGSAVIAAAVLAVTAYRANSDNANDQQPAVLGHAIVHHAVAHDVSGVLAADPGMQSSTSDLNGFDVPPNAVAPESEAERGTADTTVLAKIVVPPGAARVEQHSQGDRSSAATYASFNGLGADFVGPQGNAVMRSPSDNSLAVSADYIVQIVNARMAIFTKRGREFDTTGKALYGPVPTNNVFRGFGGACEKFDNGDAVVRYDQLANRWLIVMPIFSRIANQLDERELPKGGW